MPGRETVMAGGQPIEVHTDIHVPMRDGVTLAIDVYSGTEDKPRPALVAMSPYGKDLQSQSLKLPPQRRPSPLWDGCLEAGDIARIVREDYVHVIADLRGSAPPAARWSATTTPAACRSARTPTTSSSGSRPSHGATATSAWSASPTSRRCRCTPLPSGRRT